MSGTTYYAGTWKPAYERWVQMYAGMFAGPGKELVARNSAALYDMIYAQPVFYEFEQIKTPIVLIIGDKDTTTTRLRPCARHWVIILNSAKRRRDAFRTPSSSNFPTLATPAGSRTPSAWVRPS
jgi:hypothetical protein